MGIFDKFSKKKSVEQNVSDIHQDNSSVNNEVSSNSINPEDWFWGSFLMNEAKFRHQEKDVKRSSKEEPINLRYIIQDLLTIAPEDIGKMTIVSRGEFGRIEKTEIIESSEDVLNFKPFDALLYTNDNGETVPHTGLNTVLVISFRPGDKVFDNRENKKDKSKLYTDNSIIMFLRGIGPFIYETAYMRVSVMIPNFTSPDDFRTTHSNNLPFTTSFILGYDLIPSEQRIAKYEETEKSLNEKIKRGEELTSEEKTILEGITQSKMLSDDLGYGRWLVSQNRVSDALPPLMRVFNQVKKDVVTDYKRVHPYFNEICFNIGFCYNELEQFDRAIYYLDLISGTDNIKYTIELINAYVNGKDPRAINSVKFHLKEFNEGKRQLDSDENIHFYEFLNRRLSYLFVEYKMYDNARNLLEQMKNSTLSHDFAVSELEYINNITGQN